jgi:hypothetical protein
VSMHNGGRPHGTGANGTITADDIRAKAREVAGGAQEQLSQAKPALNYAVIAVGALVVVVAFWVGRRGGKKRTTVVEILRG